MEYCTLNENPLEGQRKLLINFVRLNPSRNCSVGNLQLVLFFWSFAQKVEGIYLLEPHLEI